MTLDTLKQQLSTLTKQAEMVDKKRGESKKPLFDQGLFKCQSRLLSPCVKEAIHTLTTIQNEQIAGRLTTLHAQHLSEKLINQISALQRELATINIRDKEKSFSTKPAISIGQIYQDLAQHQEWERRLQQMVFDTEKKLEQNSDFGQKQQLQKILLTTEQRLARCTLAKHKIENRIAHLEKKG